MKVLIKSKNYKPSERLQGNVETKFSKLGRYFQDDVTTTVLFSRFKDKVKVEATINCKQAVFRAEAAEENVYDAIDQIIDRLSNQMSKFKGRLEDRYKENKALKFEFIPSGDDEEEEELTVVKRKQFELQPMNYEEAILQMEMLGHNFFVFFDMDTNSVNVVYKRRGGDYGLIETVR